jgi:glycosyltransferase involved in cell wall biosynthesis
MAKPQKPLPVTLIIPVHNEAVILAANLSRLCDYLKNLYGKAPFEILVICNGCIDESASIAMEFAKTHPETRVFTTRERGLGLAIREGIKRARHDMLMFYAIDLPFGLEVIGASVAAAVERKNAIVIGSKGHPRSMLKRSLSRALYSLTISTLNNLFFGLGVKDTQGSILFYKRPCLEYSKEMDSDGAFFQAQILIYGKLAGHELVEIPVCLTKELRSTRFSLVSDGLKYLVQILAERRKLKSIAPN